MQGMTAVPSLAQQADKYVLYQSAVLNAHHEAMMLARVYRDAYGQDANVLREDFCGTGAICHAWTRTDPARLAWGVDLDPEPLAWGRIHNGALLTAQERHRVELLEGNAVVSGNTPLADVVSAGNYSFFCFRKRHDLREYFRAAARNLQPRGVLLMDVKGGPEVVTHGHRHSRVLEEGATYEWEVVRFDALTHEGEYRIHFHFPDGSSLQPAFEYAWRIWMPSELRDLVLEAGFKHTAFYVGLTDEEGSLQFHKEAPAPATPRVFGYLAAIK